MVSSLFQSAFRISVRTENLLRFPSLNRSGKMKEKKKKEQYRHVIIKSRQLKTKSLCTRQETHAVTKLETNARNETPNGTYRDVMTRVYISPLLKPTLRSARVARRQYPRLGRYKTRSATVKPTCCAKKNKDNKIKLQDDRHETAKDPSFSFSSSFRSIFILSFLFFLLSYFLV